MKTKTGDLAGLAVALTLIAQGCSLARNDPPSPTATPSAIYTTRSEETPTFTLTSTRDFATLIAPLISSLPQPPIEFDGTDRILYASGSFAIGEQNIAIMSSDGSHSVCLTCEASSRALYSSPLFLSPVWSPDGKSYAFVLLAGEKDGIVIRSENTGLIMELTRDAWYDDLSWSPDGRYIGWSASPFLSNADQTSPVCYTDSNLLGGPEKHCITEGDINIEPSWSRDGEKILFSSGGTYNGSGTPHNDLYLWDIESGDVMQFTDTPESELMAKWSPDGSRLALIAREDEDSVRTLYVANADGSERVPVPAADSVTGFDWSPDGTQIVYTEVRKIEFEDCDITCLYPTILKIIDLRTGAIRSLTDGTQVISDPSWRP